MNRGMGLVGSALLLAALPAGAAPLVWALNFNQQINVVNAANNAEVPFLPASVQSDSLAVDSLGVLYIADSAGQIYSVQGSISLGNSGYTQIGDLVYASGGLWGFSNANDTVFFFDLGTQSVTYSQAITSGLGNYDITGIARNPSNGDLFLSGNVGYNLDALFELDLNTASATTVGALNHTDAFSYISDIEFDGTGALIAMTWYHRDFYSVNPSTAATTLLSTGPHRDVTGLAIMTPVPEAGTGIAGALVGIGAWLQLRRRRSA
jgi:hypothetical protein